MNTQVRTRFGLRLSWPFQNAAIAIIYVTEEQYMAGVALTAQLRGILPSDIAKRLVWERG